MNEYDIFLANIVMRHQYLQICYYKIYPQNCDYFYQNNGTDIELKKRVLFCYNYNIVYILGFAVLQA